MLNFFRRLFSRTSIPALAPVTTYYRAAAHTNEATAHKLALAKGLPGSSVVTLGTYPDPTSERTFYIAVASPFLADR